MVAKKRKKSRQVKRAEQRKAKKKAPAARKEPTVDIRLTISEARNAIGGFGEMKMKEMVPFLPLAGKLGEAYKAVLTVKPKGKK